MKQAHSPVAFSAAPSKHPSQKLIAAFLSSFNGGMIWGSFPSRLPWLSGLQGFLGPRAFMAILAGHALNDMPLWL